MSTTLPIVAQYARPYVNERYYVRKAKYPSVIPAGFRGTHRRPLHSRVSKAVTPFFSNAKPARMLERGLVRSTERFLTPNNEGVLIIDDGGELDVKVVSNPPDISGNDNFTFLRLDSNPENEKIMLIPRIQRYAEWDFYTRTTPVPFVPRAGSLEAASHTTVIPATAVTAATAVRAATAATAAARATAKVAPANAVNLVGNEGGCFGAWCWTNQTRRRGGYKGKKKHKSRRRSK